MCTLLHLVAAVLLTACSVRQDVVASPGVATDCCASSKYAASEGRRGPSHEASAAEFFQDEVARRGPWRSKGRKSAAAAGLDDSSEPGKFILRGPWSPSRSYAFRASDCTGLLGCDVLETFFVGCIVQSVRLRC